MRAERKQPAERDPGSIPALLSPEAAWGRLVPWLGALPPQAVPRDRALARTLAAPLRATADVPFADVSAMDGYALAGEVAAGARLPVLGRVAAGEQPAFALDAGSTVRIMTGAPLPAGADRVVPVEDTDDGDREVVVRRPPAPGAHVRRRGEVHARGDELLASGDRLTAGALALLAAHGIAEVAAARAPRMAVLVTGDEVVPPDQEPGPAQLRDSHSAFLAAAATAAGGSVLHLGIARDDPGHLRERLQAGLEADLLVATGGVSRGELDFVEPVLASLGFEPLFDAVAIQPGKPLFAAVLRRPGTETQPERPPLVAFGLPGNPASAMVCFWLFVRPALRRLQGIADATWAGALRGTLEAPLAGAGGRDRLLPAHLLPCDGALLVTPLQPHGSHDLGAYARGTGLVRVPAGSPPAPAGAPCSVLPLGADWG
jgi:molybdopterin molybdotransferase